MGDETEVIAGFLSNGRKSLLAHPLAETFLHLKWLSVSKILMINMLLYVLYLISFTGLAVWTTIDKHHLTDGDSVKIKEEQMGGWWALHIVTSIFTSIILIREIGQAVSEGVKYLTKENIIEVITLSTSTAYLVWVTMWDSSGWEEMIAAIALFFAWIEMTLMLGRRPSIGKYTYMSIQVIYQLIKFFMVYITTLIAFGMVLFVMLAKDEEVFDNPWTSFLKVLIMMIGEYDFADNFTFSHISENQVVPSTGFGKAFPVIVQIIMILMMFLITIIIGNLITGLTVNNLSQLYKQSDIYKLGKTVQEIISVEKTMLNFPLAKKLWPQTQLATRTKPSSGKEDKVEKLLFCVAPNEIKTVELDEEDSFAESWTQEHKVYIYNPAKMAKEKSTMMRLPHWIVRRTLACLREKKKLQDELNQLSRSFLKDVQSRYSTSVRDSFSVGPQSPYIQNPKKHSIFDAFNTAAMQNQTSYEREEQLTENKVEESSTESSSSGEDEDDIFESQQREEKLRRVPHVGVEIPDEDQLNSHEA